MKRFSFLVILITAGVLCAGCGSSGSSYGNGDNQSPASTSAPVTGAAEKSSQNLQTKSDTLNVNAQNTPKPVYDSRPQTKAEPTGKYSVQVGAYKMADNAERIATVARERFGKNVYTIPDKSTDLYKVMVGDFMVKDDARRFRDDMVQKYPGDYKDAWVYEVPQK